MKKTLIIASLVLFAGSVMAANTVETNGVRTEVKKEKKEKKKKKKNKKGCCSAESSAETKASCGSGTGETKSCCSKKQ